MHFQSDSLKLFCGNIPQSKHTIPTLSVDVGTSHSPTHNPYSFSWTAPTLTPSVDQLLFLLLWPDNSYSRIHTTTTQYLYTTAHGNNSWCQSQSQSINTSGANTPEPVTTLLLHRQQQGPASSGQIRCTVISPNSASVRHGLAALQPGNESAPSLAPHHARPTAVRANFLRLPWQYRDRIPQW
jgi:hypothetical protein